MQKIRCFLDVDGVLNPDEPSSDFTDWERWVYEEPAPWGIGRSLPMITSKAMGQALQALPLDIHWLTTWKHQANWIAPKMGLAGEFPVCYGTGSDGTQFPKLWWKRKIVQKFIDEVKQPFIWIDDEIRQFALDWKKREFTVCIGRKANIPHLALSMNAPIDHRGEKNKGIRLSDLRLIEAFCQKHLNQEKQDEPLHDDDRHRPAEVARQHPAEDVGDAPR